ncbi:MAG: gliding motility-associated C-terminal domain-containing protein, partial [Flavobacteriales bacterium]|nr:gliding motility-associated C-terminal domain-containing protein [Flavobacteriales bacterium]
GPNAVVLTVTDDQGNNAICTATVTVIDTIAPEVVCQDIEIVIDESGLATIDAAQVLAEASDNCDSLVYTLDQYSWADAGSYEVTLTVMDASGNSSSCTATITVTKAVEDPLVIPSGFSPNGDGIADRWVIQGLPEGSKMDVEIFNRWGQVVYANGDYRNDWDGTCTRGLGSDMLPAGTYFYVMNISGPIERTTTAYLQIAR